MSSRYVIVFLLALSGCGAKEDDKVASAPADDRIECATSGAKDFAKACAVERGEGAAVTLRHADGGFRRIDIAADGTVTAADGADDPQGKMLPDGRFELTLGSDRYRLPPLK